MAAESPADIALRRGLSPLLMSMSEIAELARVKRPVVTTWRRRYPDFPAPAGGDAMSPLFDSGQVAEWLIGTGRDPECRIEADLSLHALSGLGAGLARIRPGGAADRTDLPAGPGRRAGGGRGRRPAG